MVSILLSALPEGVGVRGFLLLLFSLLGKGLYWHSAEFTVPPVWV